MEFRFTFSPRNDWLLTRTAVLSRILRLFHFFPLDSYTVPDCSCTMYIFETDSKPLKFEEIYQKDVK